MFLRKHVSIKRQQQLLAQVESPCAYRHVDLRSLRARQPFSWPPALPDSSARRSISDASKLSYHDFHTESVQHEAAAFLPSTVQIHIHGLRDSKQHEGQRRSDFTRDLLVLIVPGGLGDDPSHHRAKEGVSEHILSCEQLAIPEIPVVMLTIGRNVRGTTPPEFFAD